MLKITKKAKSYPHPPVDNFKKDPDLSTPPTINLCSFCPVITGFFLICVRYAYDEMVFRYDKTQFMLVKITNKKCVLFR